MMVGDEVLLTACVLKFTLTAVLTGFEDANTGTGHLQTFFSNFRFMCVSTYFEQSTVMEWTRWSVTV